MKEYSEALKRKLVQRMLMPNGRSANRLSQEVGINQPTLSRRLREATTLLPLISDASVPRRTTVPRAEAA